MIEWTIKECESKYSKNLTKKTQIQKNKRKTILQFKQIIQKNEWVMFNETNWIINDNTK